MDYDPATGIFTWRDRRGRPWRFSGKVAGSRGEDGYIYIGLGSFKYLAHRLAWQLVNGPGVPHQLDHINGDRSDNRIENLRAATNPLNMQNQRGATKQNRTSHLLGVSLCKQTGRWVAYIKKDGKKRNLGRYDTPEEAHQAYLTAKRKLHEFCEI